MDACTAEHGWLTADGKPPGFVAVYFAAINSARLALAKLDEHLVAQHKRHAPMVSQCRTVPRGKGDSR